MFKISKKTIIAGAIGNAMEMYDFVIWSVFSVYLTKEFLPPQSKLSDIFFLFFLTYFLRPVGSFFAGVLADQLGRKKILTFCVLLMGLCTGMIALLPSYEKIGVLSVFLLLFIRLLQTLTVGGEFISSVSLLIESCDKNRRGYYGSWAAVGLNSGTLLASAIGAIILYSYEKNILPSWGWRLAFVASFITMLVGFWVRRSIPESFDFVIENARKNRRAISQIFLDATASLKSNFFESIAVFVMVLFGVSTTGLIFIYAPIHMTTINHLLGYQSFLINAISIGFLIICIPFFGMLSDRYGRIRTLAIAIFFILLLVIPYFDMISSNDFIHVLFAHIIIGVPCACVFGVIPVLITEIFPLSVRCSVASFLYSLAASLGGGITPLLAFKVSTLPANHYYLGSILLLMGSITLIALLILNAKQSNRYPSLKLIVN